MKYEIHLMLTDSSYKVLMDICTIQEVNLIKLYVIFFKPGLFKFQSRRDGVLQTSDPTLSNTLEQVFHCVELLANYIQVCLILVGTKVCSTPPPGPELKSRGLN